jgi:hypothetical protein
VIQLSAELALQGFLEVAELAAEPLVVGAKNFQVGARIPKGREID